MADVATALVVIMLALGGAAVTVGWMWRTLERSQSTYRERMDKQDAQIEDLQQQVHQLHMERLADHAYMQQWIDHGRQGWRQWSELSGHPAPPEPEDRPRPVNQGDVVKLAQMIADRFSMSEIDGLAFDLELAQRISGDTQPARARSLVDAARQRGLILRLINLCRQQRPEGGF